MALIYGNEENFDSLIQNGVVLVDFYADWCGPCRMIATQLESLCEERSENKIVKINVDNNTSLAKKYGIMSIPALLLFKDGNLIDNKIGYMNKDEIEEWISKNN